MVSEDGKRNVAGVWSLRVGVALIGLWVTSHEDLTPSGSIQRTTREVIFRPSE